METGEIVYEKVYASPRPPPMISFKDNWMKKLGSEVAGHDESSQQTQPKTPNPIVRTGRPVATEPLSRSSVQEIDNVSYLAARVPMCLLNVQIKTRTQTKTWTQIVLERGVFTQREETDIDFRVSGLPHAVVKQAENFHVRELVMKIESHPHRQALQAYLQQSNAYNPLSEKIKEDDS